MRASATVMGCCQETLEGLMAHGHPGSLPGLCHDDAINGHIAMTRAEVAL